MLLVSESTSSDRSAPPEAGGVLVAAVEGLQPEMLSRLRDLGVAPARVVVTRHRAAAMGFRPDVAHDISLGLGAQPSTKQVHRLSGGAPTDLAEDHDPWAASPAESAGVALARLGHLVPAIVAVHAEPRRVPALAELLASGAILHVTTEEVGELVEASEVDVVLVSEAPVPLETAENTRFMLFRERTGLREHLAILVGDQAAWPEPLPVRLHSACLTGDIFGSLKCDCGAQLRGSITHFAESGGGVLLYLAQEGRDIGLGNKLRAYALQDNGLDTVDADCALGFGPDERRYDVAVQMLRHLGVNAIQLLTNNPTKVQAMEDAGITVADRRPLHGTLNPYNLPYVRAKVDRAGHWLHGMLAGGTGEP